MTAQGYRTGIVEAIFMMLSHGLGLFYCKVFIFIQLRLFYCNSLVLIQLRAIPLAVLRL